MQSQSEQGSLATEESDYGSSNCSSINSTETKNTNGLTISNENKSTSDFNSTIKTVSNKTSNETTPTKHQENYLRLKILNLPIPQTLQSYLLYSREI
jgi:hypothetical protein